MILSNRSLSLSASLREIPFVLELGINTKYLPGSEICPVNRAPFSPIASFTTCTKISWSAFKRFSILEFLVEPSISATYKTPFFSSPNETKAASIPGRTFLTFPR